MKTLYLHIGMARCGTTSIQDFCSNNQNELNRNGYCYPIMPFSYKFAKQNRNAHFMFGRVTDENKNRLPDIEQQYRNEGFSQLYTAFETYDNVILSDEGLWNCGFRPDARVWERLKTEMASHNFITKVIVYLRRQDEYLYSWWGQRIKEGLYAQKTYTWDQMLQEMPVVRLDYYQMLEDISPYIGKENIIVRRFGRQYFANRSLQEDFLNAIGLEFTEQYQINQEITNTGLTANSIEIKRILNHISDLTPAEDLAYRNLLTNNSQLIQEENNYSMYSEEEALAFYEQYREQNRKVALEYLGIDTDLFEFKYTAEQKWNRDNPEMLEHLVLFMAQESRQLRQELNATRALIQKQQKQINYLLNIIQHPFKAVAKKIKK